MEDILWTFNADPPNNHLQAQKQGGTTWSGIGVVSGRVRVEFKVGGRPSTVAAEIGVVSRGWSWGSSHRTFQQGAPVDLDNCITGQVGLAADVFGCTASVPGVLINPGAIQGFKVAEGSGPNAGMWYVTDPTTRMDLRTQLARRFRADEPTQAVAGVSQVVQARQAANQIHTGDSTSFQIWNRTGPGIWQWDTIWVEP